MPGHLPSASCAAHLIEKKRLKKLLPLRGACVLRQRSGLAPGGGSYPARPRSSFAGGCWYGPQATSYVFFLLKHQEWL